jgi:creatinine amidohydrolase
VGNAASADAARGRAVLDAAGRALARLLTEIHQLPLSILTDRVA